MIAKKLLIDGVVLAVVAGLALEFMVGADVFHTIAQQSY